MTVWTNLEKNKVLQPYVEVAEQYSVQWYEHNNLSFSSSSLQCTKRMFYKQMEYTSPQRTYLKWLDRYISGTLVTT